MNVIDINEQGDKIYTPSTFSEMTSKQVHYIIQQLSLLDNNAISFVDFKIKTLYKVLGLKRSLKNIIFDIRFPSIAEERNSRSLLLWKELLSFLFTESEKGILPVYDCVKQHLPYLRVGLKKYCGPADALVDISFEEYHNACLHFHSFMETHDDQQLNLMIACLYRPKGKRQPSGRCVRAYDDVYIAKLSKKFKSISIWRKKLIFLWFSACIKHIQTGEFIISGKKISFSNIFNSGEGGPDGLGWLSILFDLAERKTFGDIQQTNTTNIFDILSLLYDNKTKIDYAKNKKNN